MNELEGIKIAVTETICLTGPAKFAKKALKAIRSLAMRYRIRETDHGSETAKLPFRFVAERKSDTLPALTEAVLPSELKLTKTRLIEAEGMLQVLLGHNLTEPTKDEIREFLRRPA